ncbi:MAG: prepilin-type N-terminal cleavage/methylation domain-containing protein [Pseudomonadales bacterium]|nr:prepilin-type N-terminal cleavage/methylation domain-containing protein [Pseudomonadales bacterium]
MLDKAAKKNQRGFTLLEVIVALAITGFVLGGLFSLVAGSKQLTWRSEDNLLRATQIRAASNFALLENDYDEVEEILRNDNYRIRAMDLLDVPERKTQATTNAIQEFQIVFDEREESFIGYRWVDLDTVR